MKVNLNEPIGAIDQTTFPEKIATPSAIKSAINALQSQSEAQIAPLSESAKVTPFSSALSNPVGAVKESIAAIANTATTEVQEISPITPVSNIEIPVVDMADFYNVEKRADFIKALREAMIYPGFFAVRNTGIDGAIINTAYDQAALFFHKDLSFKEKSFDPELRGQTGFVPGETAKKIGNEAVVKDKKEFYHIRKEANLWTEQEGFEAAQMQLFTELGRYVDPLLQAVVEAINLNTENKLPLDSISRTITGNESLLRALYYPALTEEEFSRKDAPIWGAAHTDIDLLAIIPRATEKGLQVKVHGEWLTVVVPEDTFIVNVGDMLKNLTNGLFMSAEHRIIALEPNKERFSMAFFVHPTGDTPLDPLASCIEQTGGVQLYANGTRDEFLFERLIELGIAPGLADLYATTGHIERQALFNRVSPQVLDLLHEKGLISEEKYQELSRHTGG